MSEPLFTAIRFTQGAAREAIFLSLWGVKMQSSGPSFTHVCWLPSEGHHKQQDSVQLHSFLYRPVSKCICAVQSRNSEVSLFEWISVQHVGTPGWASLSLIIRSVLCGNMQSPKWLEIHFLAKQTMTNTWQPRTCCTETETKWQYRWPDLQYVNPKPP